jgi:TolB-like protein/Tfp pilus assembly protein PilF
MGIHSGPVNEVTDVNGRTNITGAGINIAQRVMDCGDAGHILLSRHLAEDLEQYPQWREHLHDLGQVEVKHGAKIDVVNFYNDEAGNAELPEKFKQATREEKTKAHLLVSTRRRKRIVVGATLFVALALIVGLWLFFNQSGRRIAAPPISEKSIAVLPFENLSAEKENAFFADGVQNEILTNLAKIADLKVISRSSVMVYKVGNGRNLREIAQQLGVAHVLEGSVQRAGRKVRVSAQLIDARTDRHVWAETYDRELADVFAIETELAQAIASELQAKLSASEKASVEEKPTQDLVAYDLYVRAVSLIYAAQVPSERTGDLPLDVEKTLSEAVDFLNKAVARDPNFLLAYCQLAFVHDLIFRWGIDHTPARLALAESAIGSAFRLSPDSGESHLTLGWHLYSAGSDYDRARTELARAQQSLPNNARVYEAIGMIDRREGRWADAAHNLERASELDPRNLPYLIELGGTYWWLRDYEQHIKVMDRLLALHQGRKPELIFRALIEMDREADTGPARSAFAKILANDPASEKDQLVVSTRFNVALFDRELDAAASLAAALPAKNSLGFEFAVNRDFWVGLVARLKGDEASARAAFMRARAQQEEEMRVEPDDFELISGLGLIDAALGRKEEALSEGRRAMEIVIGKNSNDKTLVKTWFAMIYAWAGERDLALEQLETALKPPGSPSYGDLRLNPMWDPLRGDPRFQKIVASLAPKK